MGKARVRDMVTKVSRRDLTTSRIEKQHQRPLLEEQFDALRTEFYAFKTDFLLSQELRFRELRLLREELLAQASYCNACGSSEQTPLSLRLQSVQQTPSHLQLSLGEQECDVLHAGRRFVGTGRVVLGGGHGPPPPNGFQKIILDVADDPYATLLTPEPTEALLADMVGSCICWPSCFLDIHQ